MEYLDANVNLLEIGEFYEQLSPWYSVIKQAISSSSLMAMLMLAVICQYVVDKLMFTTQF